MDIFYEKNIPEGVRKLSEEESRHCVNVLRHSNNDEIMIFDGNGGKHHSVLTDVSKNSCSFEIIKSENSVLTYIKFVSAHKQNISSSDSWNL